MIETKKTRTQWETEQRAKATAKADQELKEAEQWEKEHRRIPVAPRPATRNPRPATQNQRPTAEQTDKLLAKANGRTAQQIAILSCLSLTTIKRALEGNMTMTTHNKIEHTLKNNIRT